MISRIRSGHFLSFGGILHGRRHNSLNEGKEFGKYETKRKKFHLLSAELSGLRKHLPSV